MGVSITPGWMEFIRMPALPYSSAAFLVVPLTASLEAVSAIVPPRPVKPWTEEMLTTDARRLRNGPVLVAVWGRKPIWLLPVRGGYR
jgi:hypothetical protein